MSKKEKHDPYTPKVVNHGNVFGTGNWYVYYCGNCGTVLTVGFEKCEYCITSIDWSKA